MEKLITGILVLSAMGVQSAPLYLGDGLSNITNSPAAWNTTSNYWTADEAMSSWTTWSDGGDAIIKGPGARIVNLASGLSVAVNDICWDTTAQRMDLTGEDSQSITLTTRRKPNA